jgi:predicted nucleic acid-binding protein
MILADANLLLDGYNTDADPHAGARRWLEAALSADDLFGLS